MDRLYGGSVIKPVTSEKLSAEIGQRGRPRLAETLCNRRDSQLEVGECSVTVLLPSFHTLLEDWRLRLKFWISRKRS
jgi:hypothetical protein